MGADLINPDDFQNDPRYTDICRELHRMMRVEDHPMGYSCRMGHGRRRRAEIEANKHWEYPWCAIHGEFQPGMQVLDAGAGRGALQYYLGRKGCRMAACDIDGFRSKKILKLQRALHAVGLAPTPDLTSRLRENAKFFGFDMDVHIEPIQTLSWPDNTFDRVYSVSVLEHIQPIAEAEKAVREMSRVLKPGGKLILTVDLAPGPAYKTGEIFYPEHLDAIPKWAGCRLINTPNLSCLKDWDGYLDRIHAFFKGKRRPTYTAVGLVMEKC